MNLGSQNQFAWVVLLILAGGWTSPARGQSPSSRLIPERSGDEVPLSFRSSERGKGTVADPPCRLNLRVVAKNGVTNLQLVPEPMLPMGSKFARPFLDAAVRETAYCLQGLHAQLSVHKKAVQPGEWRRKEPPVMVFPFRLAVRALDGTALQTFQWETGIFPGNRGRIRVAGPIREISFEKRFLIEDLLINETYFAFLKALFSPVERVRMPLPRGEFVVELNYRWPVVPGCIGEGKKLRCRDGNSLFVRRWFQPHTSPPDTYYINLGKTYFRTEGERVENFPGLHMATFAQALEQREKAHRLVEKETLQRGLVTYQNYFDTVPSDRAVAHNLLKLYRKQGLEKQAQDLVIDFQPYFVHFRDFRTNKRNIQRARRRMMDKVDGFSRDETAWVRITHPKKGDTIAGTTPIRFLIAGGNSPVLRMDLFVDGKRVHSLENPPLETELGSLGTGPHRLKLRVNFENGTYQEDAISIEALRVDEQERVNLVELQAVVENGRQPVGHLEGSDIWVRENREPKKLNTWSVADVPLRVVLLIDTSVSMAEDDIYFVQDAVYRFISRFKDPDQTQIYTFDEKVLQIKDFGQSPEAVKPTLYSLSPGSLTALNDALLTARSCLEDQQETTPVLVMVGGGDDNRSSASVRQIKSLMARSSVRVYAALLKSGQRGILAGLAANSGGFSRTVRGSQGLNRALHQIYEEIQNLYYLDYYTSYAEQKERKLSITVPGTQYRVKWRVLP